MNLQQTPPSARRNRPRNAALRLLPSSLLVITLAASANDESGISVTATNGLPGAVLEENILELLRGCIESNKSTPRPGNSGPFTRAYQDVVVRMGQCFAATTVCRSEFRRFDVMTHH